MVLECFWLQPLLPGTVNTASIAGANFGFVLMWALLLSIIVTYGLEMSSRLGIVSGLGLSEALRSSTNNHFLKAFLDPDRVCISIGNAAFEVGNITELRYSSQISNLSISSSVHRWYFGAYLTRDAHFQNVGTDINCFGRNNEFVVL